MSTASSFREFYGLFATFAIIVVGILVGFFVPISYEAPAAWWISAIVGMSLFFIIPYIASVQFHSPNIFDAEGNVWSFNEEQMFIVPFAGTQMAVIACTGFDNPKKLLAHENVSSGKTTLLALPARLVESVGQRRFVVLRAAPERLTYYESQAFLADRNVKNGIEKFGARRVTVYMSLWTEQKWLPSTFLKRRVDFERISTFMANLMTELGSRRDTVEVAWRRERSEAERDVRPQVPPVVRPQKSREEGGS
ncbi:hypothetical protein HY493_00045 [Candidatus Woesearchaeota archaeon]|nr:hypothetical protein [Candidatus Woesearchaeota archaeon]